MIILINESDYKIAINKGLECFGVKNKTKVFMRRFLKNAILHYDVLKKCISRMNDTEKKEIIKNQLDNIYECDIDIPKSYIETFANDVNDKNLITLLTKALIKKKDVKSIRLIISLCEDNIDIAIKNEALSLIDYK